VSAHSLCNMFGIEGWKLDRIKVYPRYGAYAFVMREDSSGRRRMVEPIVTKMVFERSADGVKLRAMIHRAFTEGLWQPRLYHRRTTHS